MKALVVGGTSYIGSALLPVLSDFGWDVTYTTRETLNLLWLPRPWPYTGYDAVWICAAKTRFIDCEDGPDAYRINVDAPAFIAKFCQPAKVIYLSSEAVERALHTNYGMHKAMAEMMLHATGANPIVVRLSKVSPVRLRECCEFLANMANAKPGVYHWP